MICPLVLLFANQSSIEKTVEMTLGRAIKVEVGMPNTAGALALRSDLIFSTVAFHEGATQLDPRWEWGPVRLKTIEGQFSKSESPLGGLSYENQSHSPTLHRVAARILSLHVKFEAGPWSDEAFAWSNKPFRTASSLATCTFRNAEKRFLGEVKFSVGLDRLSFDRLHIVETPIVFKPEDAKFATFKIEDKSR